VEGLVSLYVGNPPSPNATALMGPPPNFAQHAGAQLRSAARGRAPSAANGDPTSQISMITRFMKNGGSPAMLEAIAVRLLIYGQQSSVGHWGSADDLIAELKKFDRETGAGWFDEEA